MKFRADLQGLRAIAILLVVFYHTNTTYFSGGFIGVDIFFVLSGYLISGILISDIDSNRFKIISFFSGRLKRLLPAMTVMVCVVFVISSHVLSSIELTRQLASAPFALSWSSNLYFPFKFINYFDELSSHDYFLHTWSLGLEAQFYLVWPIYLFLLYFFFGKSKEKNSIFVLSIIFLTILSLIFCILTTKTHQNYTFYLMPFRVWQFSLGTLAFLLLNNTKLIPGAGLLSRSNFDNLRRVCLYASILTILFCALTFDSRISYPGYLALVPSLAAMLVILSGHKASSLFLENSFLIWLGDRSYSLYLWHWPILMLGFSFGGSDNQMILILLVVLSIVIANFSYQYIEIPFWKGKFRTVNSVSFSIFSILVMVSLFIILSIFLKINAIKASNSHLLTITTNDLPLFYLRNCDSWYFSDIVEPCLFEKNTSKKDLVILGDSIGAQWFASFLMNYPLNAWRIHVYTKSSCPIVDRNFLYERIGKNFDICKSWRAKAINEIAKIKPDLLVIGSSSTYNFNKKEWVEGTTGVLDKLSPNASNVILIPGTPGLKFDGPSCLARPIIKFSKFFKNMCASDSTNHPAYRVSQYLNTAAESYENVRVLNLNDLVCNSEKLCSAISYDQTVVFRDSQHLTNSFVKSRAAEIQRRLLQLTED